MPDTPTLVLGYHNVLPTAAFAGDAPATPSFREHLRTIARRCAVVPFGRGSVHNPTRRPTVALTFDDGYLDNLTIAADLLTELRLPATFYVVTSFLDGKEYPWWEIAAAICAHPGVAAVELGGHTLPLETDDARAVARQQVEDLFTAADLVRREQLLTELQDSAGAAGVEAVAQAMERSPLMTWADVKALADAGFAIGSHSRRHAILAREDPAVVRDELVESKRRLEAELGTEVTTFSYPRGTAVDFDDTAVGLVRDAGYHHALTSIAGLNVAGTAPLRLRRLVVGTELGTAALLRGVAGRLGGSAVRALFSLAPPARRVMRSPRSTP